MSTAPYRSPKPQTWLTSRRLLMEALKTGENGAVQTWNVLQSLGRVMG
jgi:hypothetical protein